MGNLASALSLRSEEAALIAELQAGSEEAFAWLIAHYHQPIYSLLARTVHDRADAADLTQEVFVKVFRGVGRFHGESSLRTWIYRIALHEASNQRRWWMRHKQQEIPIEQEMADRASGAPIKLKEMLIDPGESPYDLALHAETQGSGRSRAKPGAGAVSHHAHPSGYRRICIRRSRRDSRSEYRDREIETGARTSLSEGHI